jgi:excisionase family DNA binding protein
MDQGDRITTTEAGRILGCSRQHVVNLCERGELASESVGRHRRLNRADVESYVRRRATGGLTRDQRRSLWVHRAVAGRVAADPVGTLALARRNIDRRLREQPASGSERWLRRWRQLLELGPDPVMDALTSSSPASRELRQNSPFAGVLTEAERLAILESFQKANPLR